MASTTTVTLLHRTVQKENIIFLAFCVVHLLVEDNQLIIKGNLKVLCTQG
jgi:hypothetical protein